MFYTFFLSLHILVSLLLVVVILLQSSKGGGLAGSSFGGGPSVAFLGTRGTATFLSRATTVLAIVFMLNSLALSMMLRTRGTPVSVTQQEIQSGAENLPRVPGGSQPGVGEAPIQGMPGSQGMGGEATPVQPPSEEGSSGQSNQQQQSP